MSDLNLEEIKAHHARTLADDDQLTISEHERGLLIVEVERLRDLVAERETEVDHQAAVAAEAIADRDRAREIAVALEQEVAHLRAELEKAEESIFTLADRLDYEGGGNQ